MWTVASPPERIQCYEKILLLPMHIHCSDSLSITCYALWQSFATSLSFSPVHTKISIIILVVWQLTTNVSHWMSRVRLWFLLWDICKAQTYFVFSWVMMFGVVVGNELTSHGCSWYIHYLHEFQLAIFLHYTRRSHCLLYGSHYYTTQLTQSCNR